MQVATMSEPRHVARAKYAEYMRAVKERHSAEYEALKNGYRELSKGNQVIDIIETFKQTGVDEFNRPRLAIVRADAKFCWFHWGRLRSQQDWIRRPLFSAIESTSPTRSQCTVLPVDTFRHEPSKRLRAVVPTIPPSLLPAKCLSKYHILWEAEWQNVPVDPMLLKHLGKSLYVVLAAWDLTPLERAVLRDSALT